jgi:thiosulfate/3-mercaptopyruvate sulfurtransferase
MRGEQSFSLITPSRLENLQTETAVHIVDARPSDQFEKRHLPNAICIEWESFCESAPDYASDILKRPGWWGKLEAVEKKSFNEKLFACGLNDTTPIVVYADGLRSKGRDGRLAWMFLYLGARQVFLLDGGIDAWVGAGFETAVGPRTPNRAPFITRAKNERRITLSELNAKFGGSTLPTSIDTRSAKEFQGEQFDYQPRLGRIPGSINIDFEALYRKDQTFIGRDEFLGLLPPLVAPQFTYCEVGVRASTFALLYELYMGKILPVYDGSFMEWSLEPTLLVETGPQQTP